MDYIKKGIVLIVADILSLVTIGLCLVAKVPQIKTLYSIRSARGIILYYSIIYLHPNWHHFLTIYNNIGISTTSLYLEILSYTVMMSYNYCNGYFFLSYLEYPILLIQDYIILFLVLKYKHLLSQNAYIGSLMYIVVTLSFLSKILPTFILAILVVNYFIL